MSNGQDWDRFFNLVDEFAEDLELNAVAMADPPVLRRLKFKLLEISGYDRYIAEKAGEISEHLEILFSARRHKGYTGGSDAVYSKIAHDLLGRIRQRAKVIQMGLTEGGGVAK
ncbi:MAG: hypothetical protein QG662_1634 [Pseudomonadota bacterium]|nr:hypothetical protein [Pseudomonadota bacterium]